jgi:hypothetical protein
MVIESNRKRNQGSIAKQRKVIFLKNAAARRPYHLVIAEVTATEIVQYVYLWETKATDAEVQKALLNFQLG